jgi:hypothetical protein
MNAKFRHVALRMASCIYGAFIFMDGTLRVINSVQGSPKPKFAQLSAESFNHAIFANPFMDPLLGVSFMVAGLALFFNRTTPLGVAILMPSFVVIFFFHLFLTGQVVWGAGHLLFLLFLCWVYRRAFTPLWNYSNPAT